MQNLAEAKQALKAAEEALEDAIERQSVMETQHYRDISEIVHDLKNPLSAMMGYLSLIRHEVAGPMGNDTYTNYFETLDTSTHRLLGICNSLLGEYTDTGKHNEKAQTVNVSTLADEVRDLFAAQAKERNITLEAKVDENMPELRADPQDLYRALMNLVSNAIKFTRKGGKVQIKGEVDKEDNAFIMVVRDSGVGMSKKQIDQVIHSHVSTVSPHGDIGTGQGLSIVNRIVRELGGKLDIISTENRGTKIKLRFPKKRAFMAKKTLRKKKAK